MSKEKPEVGDVWKNLKNEDKYVVVQHGAVFVEFIGMDFIGKGFFGHASTDFFIKEFAYLGKSKVNINDLFEVE